MVTASYCRWMRMRYAARIAARDQALLLAKQAMTAPGAPPLVPPVPALTKSKGTARGGPPPMKQPAASTGVPTKQMPAQPPAKPRLRHRLLG